MQIRLSTEQMQQIEAHLEAAYPNEGAGFLLGRAGKDEVSVESVMPLPNLREAEAQHNRYVLSPMDFIKAEDEASRLGLALVGVFHSHPDHPAKPSQFDLDHAWPNLAYFITSVKQGKSDVTYAWRMREDHSQFDEDSIAIG
jgi:proteasome lid subunit RPN8/RPN11